MIFRIFASQESCAQAEHAQGPGFGFVGIMPGIVCWSSGFIKPEKNIPLSPQYPLRDGEGQVRNCWAVNVIESNVGTGLAGKGILPVPASRQSVEMQKELV